jgi:hypothetical protein
MEQEGSRSPPQPLESGQTQDYRRGGKRKEEGEAQSLIKSFGPVTETSWAGPQITVCEGPSEGKYSNELPLI